MSGRDVPPSCLRRSAASALPAAAALLLWTAACSDEPAPAEPAGAPPVVREITPQLVRPGQAVELSGASFGSDPALVEVSFGDLAGDVLSVEPDRIVVTVPQRAPLGPTAVRLRVGEIALAAGSVTIVAAGPPFTSVSPGGGFTCGIRVGSGAFCWGAGNRGTLGTGETAVFRASPARVAGGASFTAVGAGSAHACALDALGHAWCWGRNDVGQLGTGAAGDASAPVAVAGDERFVELSVGFAHTCALTGDGRALCWGDNEAGQLGDGTREDRRSPVAVAGDLRWSSVTAGGTHTCAVDEGGRAHCWGLNRQGELGTGDRAERLAPAPVVGGHTFVSLSAASAPPVELAHVGDHTCGVTTSAGLLCWGYNGEGQLGIGSFGTVDVPTPVTSERSFAVVAAGAFYTCAVSVDGETLCWGQNDSGQLGSGATNRSVTRPVTVVGNLGLRTVQAGKSSKTVLVGARPHTCGVSEDGTAFCWGSNATGQLGDGTTGDESLPVPVLPGD